MKLNKLANTEADIEIKGVTSDSREAKQGFLYGSLNGDFVADVSALERDFDFKPSTSLRNGLRSFARWYKEFYCV